MATYISIFTRFSHGALLGTLLWLWMVLAGDVMASPQREPLPPATPAVAVTIERALVNTPDTDRLRTIYRNASFQPLWYGTPEGRERDRALRGFTEKLVEHGFSAQAYRLPRPLANTPLSAAAYDLAMSINLIAVIEDLKFGRISPDELGIEWDIARDQRGVEAIVAQIVNAIDPRAALESLLPAHPHYRSLQGALNHYRRLAEAGGWSQVPDDLLLRHGAIDPRVTTLRERLVAEFGWHEWLESPAPEVFDTSLEEAVREFQRRYGLEPDGLAGRETLAVLNISATQRADQIEANLERWRWLPRDLGDRHILVNAANFSLSLYDGDKRALDMRVIVGKTYRQTPILSKPMRYLVLNPTWTVPPKILRRDILPKLVEDPEYLKTKGMQVFNGWEADAQQLDLAEVDWSKVSTRHSPYRVQQSPGAQNALGQVKFMFPNAHSVYIHDTPNRGLFSERVRAFSSGCVRVEHPLKLAEALLATESGDAKDWRVGLESGATTNVLLPKPLPVHLVYMTAWVDDQGITQFRRDIYQRDHNLQLALNRLNPREKARIKS